MNSQFLRFGIALIVALALQATVVQYLQISHWKPDLVLIILVMIGLNFGENVGSTAGFVVGLLGDLITGSFLGLGALAKSIAGFTAGKTSGLFQEKSRIIFVLFISGFLHDLIVFYVKMLGKDVSWLTIVGSFIVPNLFYTALIGGALNYLLEGWFVEDEVR